MNANDLTYGIEIETIAPDRAVRDDGLRIGGYRRGIQVPYLPAGWTAEADGSIDNSHGGHKCEIVSPVLRGAAGLAQAGWSQISIAIGITLLEISSCVVR